MQDHSLTTDAMPLSHKEVFMPSNARDDPNSFTPVPDDSNTVPEPVMAHNGVK